MPFAVELEAGLSFNLNSTDNYLSTHDKQSTVDLLIAHAFGFFLAEGFQVGFQPIINVVQEKYECSGDSSYCDDTKSTVAGGGLNVFARFVFGKTGRVHPYLGFLFGFLAGSDKLSVEGEETVKLSFNDVHVGPELGVKILVGRRGIFTVLMRYQFSSIEVEHVDERDGRHNFGFGTAFGVWI